MDGTRHVSYAVTRGAFGDAWLTLCGLEIDFGSGATNHLVDNANPTCPHCLVRRDQLEERRPRRW